MEDLVLTVFPCIILSIVMASFSAIFWKMDTAHNAYYGYGLGILFGVATTCISWLILGFRGVPESKEWAWASWVVPFGLGVLAVIFGTKKIAEKRQASDEKELVTLLDSSKKKKSVA